MKFEVNSNASSFRALNNLNRVGNLLSMAVSRLSNGLRVNNSADDATGYGMAENLGKAQRESKQKLESYLEDSPIKVSDQVSDQILASPSGWARMGALSGSLITSQPSNPETLVHTVNLARQDIVEDPETALRAQANQRPDSILKLLE